MKGKYLNPKTDLTFKKIFGEHPDLTKSLLNALLPLESDGLIDTLEILPPELVPDTPEKKDSIVDVRCKDQRGRQFIVEMQLYWNNTFTKRVILNASKAIVKQVEKGKSFKTLQPVYSLNFINDTVFDPNPDEFYHDYAVVNVEHSDRILEGLRFVFVELPKFKPQTMLEKRMAVLWLRFMTEIDEDTTEVPPELLQTPETSRALEILEQSAYTDAQMEAYDKFWDSIYMQRILIDAGEERGRAEGEAIGRAEERLKNARKMKAKGLSANDIADITGLPVDEVERL